MEQRLLSIYIGNEVIRIVDVTRKSASSIIVNSVDEVSTPAGCVDDGYITDIVEVASSIRGKIIGKSTKAKAVFTISSKKIASKEVVIPFVSGEKKITNILNANSGEYFPMSTTGEFLFAHNVMENFMDEEGKKLRINAVAAPKDLVEGYYELANELKLGVYDIDYVGNSVQQLLKLQMSTNENDTNLVLQIEKDTTFVNVMAGRDIILQRSVPYGKNAVINSMMEIKKLTEKEAIELLKDRSKIERSVTEEEYSEAVRYLISSIGRIVEYHRSRNPERIIDGIKVFGEGASIAGIDEVLKQELGADVTRFTSLQGVKVSQKSYLSSDQALRFLACFGAVLNPIGLNINQAKAKGESANKAANTILYALIAVAVVVIGVLSLMTYFKLRIKQDELETKKASIAQMEEIEQIQADYFASVEAYNTMKVFVDETHSDTVMLYPFLRQMEQFLPTGSVIDTIEVVDGDVVLKMKAPKKIAAADLLCSIKDAKIKNADSEDVNYIEDAWITNISDTFSLWLYQDVETGEIIAAFPAFVYEDDYVPSAGDEYIYTNEDVTYELHLKLNDPDYEPGVIEATGAEAAPSDDTSSQSEDILEEGDF